MKSILITIKPEQVEKIASGDLTILVRKTKPKLKPPFKCYIYTTKGNGMEGDYLATSKIQCGRVVGEFICDWMDEWNYKHPFGYVGLDGTCLERGEVYLYGLGATLYGWHISDLKIYDKSEDLVYYGKPCEYVKYDDFYGCWYCDDWEYGTCGFICPISSGGESNDYEDGGYCLGHGRQPRFQPPADWCYMGEIEEYGELSTPTPIRTNKTTNDKDYNLVKEFVEKLKKKAFIDFPRQLPCDALEYFDKIIDETLRWYLCDTKE